MHLIEKYILVYAKDTEFRNSTLLAIAFFLASLVCNFYAGSYATREAGSSVNDLILDHLPVYNITYVFIYGTVLFWTVLVLTIIYKPQRIPFVVKSLSLFILVRSLFVMLTHIGPAVGHVVLPAVNIMDDFTFGGDLFFSGHTGLPFLLALIFWEELRLRVFFLITTVLFASVVLLGHLHYSIDVLGAVFITYTIFSMAQKLFKKDQLLLKNGLGVSVGSSDAVVLG
jgi:hypothetical protein